MSAFEAVMWLGEVEPQLRSATTSVLLMDCEPAWTRFLADHDWLTRAAPRFRQKVVVPAFGAAQPTWVDDPEFDLTYHVRHTRLPGPGSERQLLDLAARIGMSPFDRHRPPWEAHLVEGLEGGRAGYILKLHHSAADGLGIMQLLGRFFTESRDEAPRPEPLPIDPWPARPRGSTALTAKALGKRVQSLPGQGLDVVSGAARRASALVTRPEDVAKALGYVDSARRILGTRPAKGSPLFRRRGINWRFDAIEIPLAEMKSAANAVDGSVNDVLLAGLMGGFRRYHEAMGVEVDAMPIGFPISLRKKDDPMGGNKFAGSQYAAPIGERDPAARVRHVQAFVKRMRAEPALDLMVQLMPLVTRLPIRVVTRLIGDYVAAQDAQISNIPGLARPSYLAGAQMTHLFPFAPAPGCGMMIAMVSHNGHCCIGINSDRAAVTEPDLLCRCLREGLDELLALGRGV